VVKEVAEKILKYEELATEKNNVCRIREQK
jgi:hypothetical protein